MTMIKIYLYTPGKKVLLPTVGETEDGIFIECAPLRVFHTAEVDKWKAKVYELLSQPMPILQSQEGAQEPGSIILDKLQLDSWGEFEKHATLFTIHKGARYISIYATGKGEDGMWSQALSTERKFHSRAPLEVIVEAFAQDIICHPETIEKPPTLLLGSTAPSEHSPKLIGSS